MMATRKPVRMDRYSHRQVLTWERDAESSVCRTDGVLSHVYFASTHSRQKHCWKYIIRKEGEEVDEGWEQSQRKAEIACERWMREYFKKTFPI